MLLPVAFVLIIAFVVLALFLILRKNNGKQEKR
ncbi:hypothetical protein GGR35_003514 [Mucilaginibacter phyllosphaerae]|uniref:LPXTG cell wall anchor domain-containing protein n=1 Tax=Mucilaginibacter phyllosphaerae TaxID=1812349 RepID=A0ABR6ICV6_9SPHI|nr:hypothetical protein [Mucilaginibacter phyllosphaerae]